MITDLKYDSLDVAYMKRSNDSSYYYIHNINLFSRLGGFDQFQEILSIHQKSNDDPSLEYMSRPSF